MLYYSKVFSPMQTPYSLELDFLHTKISPEGNPGAMYSRLVALQITAMCGLKNRNTGGTLSLGVLSRTDVDY